MKDIGELLLARNRIVINHSQYSRLKKKHQRGCQIDVENHTKTAVANCLDD